MSRLGRFLHLERERPGDGDDPSKPAARTDRFGALERESAEPPASATGFGASRFDRATVVEAPIRVRADDGGQPFVRCAECRQDNSLAATRCQCDADLTTPRQRAFNDALWQRLVAEREELAVETGRLTASRATADSELRDAQRRAMGVLHGDLRRQDGGLGTGNDDVSLGRWLLRLVPDPRLRLGVLAGLVVLVVGVGFWRPVAVLPLAVMLFWLFGTSISWRRF